MLRLLTVSVFLVSEPLFAADALSGTWILNVARSHYGVGAEPRRKEIFDCQWRKQYLNCSIQSVRTNGRSLTGTFLAAYEGKTYPSSGIPGVDQVSLSRVGDFVADATFSFKGKPVFGYRAVKSDDERSLTIISVDPVTRKALTSVITYDRDPLR